MNITLVCTDFGAQMKQAAFTELRNNAKLFFDQVEAGETIRILRNGKPIADIVPISPSLPSWKRRAATPLADRGQASVPTKAVPSRNLKKPKG
jgi:prevent-host-death family protein